MHTDVSITKSGWDSAENLIDGADGAIPPVVARIFSGDSNLTFDKGRAWMPEVERPKALSMDA